MYLGAHISIAKGLSAAVKTALKMQGNTFQFFSRNPRGGAAKALDPKDIADARLLRQENNFGPLVAHAPYTYNLASVKPEVREFSLRTIKDDLLRIEQMGVPNLVVHIGTHGGQGVEEGIRLVARGLTDILEMIPSGVYLLLEAMAGEGTELGSSFDEVRDILRRCDDHPQLGVCIDSCHMTGAGYDLRELDKVKEEIDRTIGLLRVRAFHLNDTMYPLASKRDRHAKLGEGHLGLETILGIVRDPDFQKIPFILETPNDDEGYAAEIALVRSRI
jgi:deoxyribonuclease-4